MKLKGYLTITVLAAALGLAAGMAQAAERSEANLALPADMVMYSAFPAAEKTTQINPRATIAVARLDGGRLIPTPHDEEADWDMLDDRLEANIMQLGVQAYLNVIPEISYPGQDTQNKIDEIRLAAADQGMDYVLIYGLGEDARWGSLGQTALVETGLLIGGHAEAWTGARSKALLVDSFSGEVLGAVTANEIDYNIGKLSDRVFDMITELSLPSPVQS